MTNEIEGTARPGDYGYEAIGAHHEKTEAVEETVTFYVGHGPLENSGDTILNSRRAARARVIPASSC